MKFAYIDESGDSSQGDVFTMAGILIDAHKLRKWTADFDEKFRVMNSRHRKSSQDFKTKKFINGADGWGEVDPTERKVFLTEIVDMVICCGKVHAFGLSFEKIDAIENNENFPKNQTNYWLASAMYISSVIQKRNQKEHNNKGHTVLIFDDNKRDITKLFEALHVCDEWYDGLYSVPRSVYKKTEWVIGSHERFDQIINTAFSIKSEHSSLVQVADIISYIYRRYLELKNQKENYTGENNYYSKLVAVLDKKREKLGRVQKPRQPCVEFYNHIRHPNWDIEQQARR